MDIDSAMDIDRFWDLIERARLRAGHVADRAVRDLEADADQADQEGDYWDFDGIDLSAAVRADGVGGWPAEQTAGESDDDRPDDDEPDDDEPDDDEPDEYSGVEVVDPVATALVDILCGLSVEEIAAFDAVFEGVRATADRDDIANAAILIEHGFLGDDSFEDFRAGLVALGRTTYERALADPDSLGEHVLIREIAAAGDPRWVGREDMIFAASVAYERVTGDVDGFFEFAERAMSASARAGVTARPAGTASPDTTGGPGNLGGQGDWTVVDEEETRSHLPLLSELFYVRSMRNRQRAMDKLRLTD